MKKITIAVTLGSTVLLIVYDLVAVLVGGEAATISALIWDYSKYPAIPFSFGFLMGHFFWQRRG